MTNCNNLAEICNKKAIIKNENTLYMYRSTLVRVSVVENTKLFIRKQRTA